MKRLSKKQWGQVWKLMAVAAVIIIVSCAITINSVNQPSAINAGTPLNITVNSNITTNTGQTSSLIVGILVPKVWNASSNATVTFTSDITSGSQPMTVIPSTTAATGANGVNWPTDMLNTLGHGGNLINEYEWVAFESNSAYSIGGNVSVNVTVSITINVGQANVWFNMGYVVCESSDGLHSSSWGDPSADYFGTFFPGAIRVFGSGTLLDFVHPQLSVITPSSANDNDIVAVPFNSTLVANGLSGASQVYLCATGYLDNGDSVVVCGESPQSSLTQASAGNWQMDIWPRGYFNLQAGQILDSMHYFFTDQPGTIKVGYGGGASPFSFTFGCQ